MILTFSGLVFCIGGFLGLVNSLTYLPMRHGTSSAASPSPTNLHELSLGEALRGGPLVHGSHKRGYHGMGRIFGAHSVNQRQR